MPLVYVVEDSPTQRALLERALATRGHEVRAFADAELALAALGERTPALLVTDVLLPGRSGIELLRELRERHGRLELPVIVVSTLGGLDHVARGYEAGADDYLVKPVVSRELWQKVDELLARSEHARGAKPEEEVQARYELLEPLGPGGGAATTWRARRRDGVELALKILPKDAGSAAVARLLVEAELLRSLEVEGIVAVRDVGTDGGRAYYAMDLLEGTSLRRRLDREGSLKVGEAAGLARRLAITLAGLADERVIHGDVAPSNVIVGADPASCVLIDFGLAHRAGEPNPTRGGTPAYVAPEVVRGEPGSHRADVYSLGTILFEALTGALPYPARGDDLVALKVAGSPPDLEPLLALDVPPGVVAVVEEALTPDPERRVRDAREVAVALLPYAGESGRR